MSDAEAAKQSEESEKKPAGSGGGLATAENIEADEETKKQAGEMIETAYAERPTLVLPGSGGTITGTAVSEWLDDDGNPKYANDDDAPAAKLKDDTGSADTDAQKEQQQPQENSDKPDAENSAANRNTSDTSDRGQRADQTAEDAGKSVEQLNAEAQERAEGNIESDKEFNAEVLKLSKEKTEA